MRIELRPLDVHASNDLASELLKKLPSVPVALGELLTAGAEGNPFYMEELVRMLIDKRAIATGDAWSLNADRLTASEIPATLVGVLQTRLDALPPDERAALQQASVIGPAFSAQALGALDPRAETMLPQLLSRELVIPNPAGQGDGSDDYSFKHHLLYEVTYGTVLKPTRRLQHVRLARWLATQAERQEGRHGDVLGIVAHHYERAGEADDAAEFHARAAEHAVERFAHAAVLEHVERGLGLLDRSSGRAGLAAAQAPLRWRLLLAREQTNKLTARRAAQRVDLSALEALVETLALDTARAELARRRASLAQALADWPAAERHARSAIALSDMMDDPAGRLTSQVTLALALRGQARLDDAQTLAERGLEEARRRGARRNEWSFLRALALIYETQGREMKSAEMELLAMAVARETGDRFAEALGLDCMGQVAIYLGELDQAQRSFEDALRLQRELGLRAMEAHAGAYLAAVFLWRGEYACALTAARQALDAARAAEHRYAEAWALYRVGEAELALGHQAEAGEALQEAANSARAQNIGLLYTAMAGLAKLALVQGSLRDAGALIETLLAHLSSVDFVPDTTFHPELVAMTCHDVLASIEDDRAPEWLERAHALMLAVAQGLTDPAQQESHLRAMPHRRRIESAWRALQAGQREAVPDPSDQD
jgi:predicted ATPase